MKFVWLGSPIAFDLSLAVTQATTYNRINALSLIHHHFVRGFFAADDSRYPDLEKLKSSLVIIQMAAQQP